MRLELQKLLSKQKLPDFIDAGAVEKQLTKILDLAADGLKKRGFGEEVLLAPLYERVHEHTNPAKAMLDGVKRGIPLKSFIEQYAAV